MGKIKCVIFDVGDTLLNRTEAGEKARASSPEIKILKKHGFKFSKQQVKKAFDSMNKKTKNLPSTVRLKDKTIYARTFMQELGLKPSKKLAWECEKNLYAEVRKHMKLMPHARSILKFLKKKKVMLCVISNTRTGSNLKAAKKLGIRKYFKHFIMTHEFGSIKSELRVFKHALERINKNRKQKILPKECLMVGNDVQEDGAAKLVGMKTAILKPTMHKKQHLKRLKPDFLLNDLREVKRIIETKLGTTRQKFLQKIQQERMKDLWNNGKDKEWEKS